MFADPNFWLGLGCGMVGLGIIELVGAIWYYRKDRSKPFNGGWDIGT